MTAYAAAADSFSGQSPSWADGFTALRQMLAVASGDGRGHAPGPTQASMDAGSTSTKIRSAAVPAKPDGAHTSHPRPRVGSDGPAPAQGGVRRPGGDSGRPGSDTRGPEDDRGPDADGRRPPAEVVGSTEIWRLVERAQAGDVEAFGQIYDRYLDTVFRYVYFRVGSRTLAEDLTQEAFLRALRRINSFTWQGRDLGAWLVTIARNLVADHFKSGRYRLEMSTSEVLDADREDRGPEGSPEAAVVSRLTNATLLAAVKRLGAEQQECIVLRFLQGFSVAETARAMGKNEGAIKALQYRAVRALARLLPEGFSR